MSINQKIEEIVKHFKSFESWEDKYKEIIQLGKKLNSMPEEFVTDGNKVKGCQSQVWLYPDMNSSLDSVQFFADSDALIAKGLIALVLKVYNESSAQEIISTEASFIADIGLKEHLSPNRSNGLLSMVKQIKLYAFALKMKSEM